MLLGKWVVTYNVVGFTTSKGLLLDLDGIDYEIVKNIAYGWCERHKLRGFIITETSKGNYNVIFDKRMSWKNSLSLAGKVALYLGKAVGHEASKKYVGWLLLQLIKKAMTVRVSSKAMKPRPKILIQYGTMKNVCRNFLEVYEIAKNL